MKFILNLTIMSERVQSGMNNDASESFTDDQKKYIMGAVDAAFDGISENTASVLESILVVKDNVSTTLLEAADTHDSTIIKMTYDQVIHKKFI